MSSQSYSRQIVAVAVVAAVVLAAVAGYVVGYKRGAASVWSQPTIEFPGHE